MDECEPIHSEYNYHYNYIIVLTKQEVRLYDAKDGKLIKVHAELIDSANGAEITSFCQDNRHRKFYLGDN